MAPKNEPKIKVVAENRRGRFDYEILDTFEAGIQLTGTEVKSLRAAKATIAESYAGPNGEEFFLFNCNIPEYLQANRFNHEPKRPRRLLLHKKEIGRLIGAVQRDGLTVVPLKLYFNEQGRAKLQIALARGKKLHDKRDTEKKRDWQRDQARILRDRGRGLSRQKAATHRPIRHGRACPGHPRLERDRRRRKSWMPGTRPGMTR